MVCVVCERVCVNECVVPRSDRTLVCCVHEYEKVCMCVCVVCSFEGRQSPNLIVPLRAVCMCV